MARAAVELRTFPGAALLIRSQAEHGPVIVVSGALELEIEFGLAHLLVRELVQHIISAEHTKVSKPDPEGYLMGIDWLRTKVGSRAAQSLVFEDSLAGISAAKAAGLTVVALAHSYSLADLEKSGADLILPSLADVTPSVLTELYARVFG